MTYDPKQIDPDAMLGALKRAREEAARPAALGPQDVEYIRALERVQVQRPPSLSSTARIAPQDEGGVPLVIHGKLLGEDGKTPIAAAVVFAYHTDRQGLYHTRGTPAHSWRLRGWAETDEDGRFEFQTIRPAAYPSRNQPAHVHLTVFASPGRYHAGGLLFEDDPLLSAADRETSARAGLFGEIRPVRREDSTEHVEVVLRIDPDNRF